MLKGTSRSLEHRFSRDQVDLTNDAHKPDTEVDFFIWCGNGYDLVQWLTGQRHFHADGNPKRESVSEGMT